MRKIRPFVLFMVFFLGLLAYSCHKEEYTSNFLPAPAIKYIPANDTLRVDSLSTLGLNPIVVSDSIKSVVGLASVKCYALKTRALSDTSSFLTTTDTVLLREYTSFNNQNLFVSTDTLTFNKNYIGYYIVATDTRGQAMKRKQVLISSPYTRTIGITTMTISTGTPVAPVWSTIATTATISAQGVISGTNTTPNCVSVSGAFVVAYATATAKDPIGLFNNYSLLNSSTMSNYTPFPACMDFVLWSAPASGTNISVLQLASIKYVSSLGTAGPGTTSFFGAANVWPTLNKTIFLKVNDRFKNIGLAVTSVDLNSVDMTNAVDPINVMPNDIILCQTATGIRALMHVQSIVLGSPLTKSKMVLTIKATLRKPY